MLLKGMHKDRTSILMGELESGEWVILGIPIPTTAFGRSEYDDGVDVAMDNAEEELKRKARADKDHYYSIGIGYHEGVVFDGAGTPTDDKSGEFWSIPYIIF